MKLSLGNILDGADRERFDHLLQEVVDDIRDPNTKIKAARSVTLTLTLRPQGESREVAAVELAVSNKLGGLKKVTSLAFLDDAGVYTADPRQTTIPEPDITPENARASNE